MRQRFISYFSALWLAGCGGSFAEINGSVDGLKTDGMSAFWGGPFLVFVNTEMECDQLSWVDDKYSLDTDELLTDKTFNALQFTYASAEIQDGKLSIAPNNSPATGWFIASKRGQADTYKSTTGNLDTTLEDDRLSGTFDVSFGESGSLDGEFEVEKCNNLKPRR
tara:strand:+ start:235 stop:729 length:495 start_codon:yes stop_codon:yes gene_type:complete